MEIGFAASDGAGFDIVRFCGEIVDMPADARYAPPLLGEHMREILRGESGYSAEKLQSLSDKGVVR